MNEKFMSFSILAAASLFFLEPVWDLPDIYTYVRCVVHSLFALHCEDAWWHRMSDPALTQSPLPWYCIKHMIYLLCSSVNSSTVTATEWPTGKGKTMVFIKGLVKIERQTLPENVYFCQPVSFLSEYERKFWKWFFTCIWNGYLKNSF